MTMVDIKNWLEEAIALFEEVVDGHRDIQENIKSNRRIFGVAYRKREENKDWVLANKPNALPYLVELAQWMTEWYKYFNTGYRPESGETIETLPRLILERLRWIRERIENL